MAGNADATRKKPKPSADDSRETRKVAPNVIDQRQQQIDPAGHHRVDRNAIAKPSMKQPGGRHPDGKAVEAALDRAGHKVADESDDDRDAGDDGRL